MSKLRFNLVESEGFEPLFFKPDIQNVIQAYFLVGCIAVIYFN